MEQAMSAINRPMTSNAAINALLGGAFVVLGLRSWGQEQIIKSLEEEKDSLLKANKQMKSTLWEWKQTLYAEAEVDPQKALVPLSTLRSIYDEVVTPIPGGDDKRDAQPSKPKFMIS